MFQFLFNLNKKEPNIAYIFKKEEDNQIKWILTNIDGWRITSLYNSKRMVNKKFKKSYDLSDKYWIVTYGDYSFKFYFNYDSTVKVMYVDKHHERLSDAELSIYKYRLENIDNNYMYLDEENTMIYVYGCRYRNVIGKLIKISGRQVVVELDDHLKDLTPNPKKGCIYPLKESSYILIPCDNDINDLLHKEKIYYESGIIYKIKLD